MNDYRVMQIVNKIKRDYNSWRDNMLTLPPEVIFNHAIEIVFMENVDTAIWRIESCPELFSYMFEDDKFDHIMRIPNICVALYCDWADMCEGNANDYEEVEDFIRLEWNETIEYDMENYPNENP